jgi:uncharacterized membrane protein
MPRSLGWPDADKIMNKTNVKKGRMSLLTGATLFFVLVVYFNFRSPGQTEFIDWTVMGLGALFVVFALIKRLLG